MGRSVKHVVIVGGGYSGSALAVALAARGTRATLVERVPEQLGRGVAYGRAEPVHLLNVRAGGMGADSDDGPGFVRWLEGRGSGDAATFAPRTVYGDYLAERLARAVEGGGVEVVQGRAVDVVTGGDGAAVMLADGRVIPGDHAVLATGNPPPAVPHGFDGLSPPLLVADPWGTAMTAGLGEDATVLLLGTGLTAVDVALSLDEAGFGGRIVALSRRGLMPRAHGEPGERPAPPETGRVAATALLRAVRHRGEAIGWRGAVDALRPVTQALWQGAGTAERSRFLRHLRPWWDVHRHRIAPEIMARIEGMRADGRLTALAGRPLAVRAAACRAVVDLRPRGGGDVRTIHASRIVNCTGPATDAARGDPLLARLLAAGRMRKDGLGLGFDVDEGLRVVAADGVPDERLHAIGPVTRARFWEVVAVPDIRDQVTALADRLVRPGPV